MSTSTASGRLLQRAHLAVGIVPIPLFHVSQHGGIAYGFSLLAQLFPAPLRALGAGGREEYLHLRVGQDSRAHIAPIHHHVVCLCHAALQPKQVVAHGRKADTPEADMPTASARTAAVTFSPFK